MLTQIRKFQIHQRQDTHAEKQSWNSDRVFFENPFLSDITIATVKNDRMWDLPNREDDQYDALIRTSFWLAIETDGNVRKNTTKGMTGMENLIIELKNQHLQTGSNVLNVTDEQFDKIEAARIRALRSETQLQTIMQGVDVEKFNGVLKKSVMDEAAGNDNAYETEVWDRILSPAQRESILARARTRFERAAGPYLFFLRDEAVGHDPSGNSAKSARSLVNKFRSDLMDIELKLIEQSYALLRESCEHHDLELRVDLSSRPEKLEPSMFYLFWKANKMKIKNSFKTGLNIPNPFPLYHFSDFEKEKEPLK